MEPESGPLVRFVLVYSPQVSDLIIFAAHAICDGIALANLVRDILICYGEPNNPLSVIYPPIIRD